MWHARLFVALVALTSLLHVTHYVHCEKQLVLQPTTLQVQLVDCDYQTIIDPVQSPFALCPDTTCNVVVYQTVAWLDAEAGSTWYANMSVGCCPVDTYGIYDSTDRRLYGCCGPKIKPGGDETPVPCFNYQRQLIGCTNFASRCCGDQICGEHYVCCGEQCCPEGGIPDFYEQDASCSVTEVVDPFSGETTEVYDGCLASPLFACQPLNTYNVVCPPFNPLDPVNQCPYCPYGDSTCVFPPPNSAWLDLPCGASSDCVVYDMIIGDCGGLLTGCVDGVSTVDLPAGCTNKLHDATNTCINTNASPLPLFVGDRAADETCCGPFICGKGMRCCSNTTTTPGPSGLFVNTTDYYGCCPDVPEIECCYNNILNPADLRHPLNFFCGAVYDTVPCQVDKMRSPLYFAMAQLLRNYTVLV